MSHPRRGADRRLAALIAPVVLGIVTGCSWPVPAPPGHDVMQGGGTPDRPHQPQANLRVDYQATPTTTACGGLSGTGLVVTAAWIQCPIVDCPAHGCWWQRAGVCDQRALNTPATFSGGQVTLWFRARSLPGGAELGTGGEVFGRPRVFLTRPPCGSTSKPPRMVAPDHWVIDAVSDHL